MTVQAMKAGAVEFLTKPFNDEVCSAIRNAIARSQAVDGGGLRALRDRTPRFCDRGQE